MKKRTISRGRGCALVCAVTMAWALWAGDSAAFVTRQTTSGLPVRWPAASVAFEIDPAFDAEMPGGTAAVRAALESWAAVGGAPLVTATVGTGDARPAVDGKNIVYFAKGGYPDAHGALAVTRISFDEATGDVVDADIVVNGKYDFGEVSGDGHHGDDRPIALDGEASDDAPAGPFDLAHVVAHEGGHALGLRDEPSQTAALMYPGTYVGKPSLRAPSADDAAGMTALYVSAAKPTQPAAAGGCGGATVAPARARGPGAALLLALGAVGLGLKRRRGRAVRHGEEGLGA